MIPVILAFWLYCKISHAWHMYDPCVVLAFVAMLAASLVLRIG